MSKLFSRKYMRGRPKRTEQFVGFFVLGLAGFIALSFLLTGGLFKDAVASSSMLSGVKSFYQISEKPLFRADDANLTAPAESHEQRMAEAMLPESGPLFVRSACVAHPVREDHVVTLGDAKVGFVSDLLAAALDYDGRWLYSASYTLSGSDGSARAIILDLATPEQAFGMYSVRRSLGDEPLKLGRHGWQGSLTSGDASQRVWAFWSGRYYSEIWASADARALGETLARATASTQLAYGGPFWANDVLPHEQRVADSFRYVRKSVLGLEMLADGWLADYAGKVTVGVMAMTPDAREKTLSALREQLRDQESGESEEESAPAKSPLQTWGESAGSETVVGTFEGREVLLFPASEYLFVMTGDATPVTKLAQTTLDRWSMRNVQAAEVVDIGTDIRSGGGARFAEIPGGRILAPADTERYTDNVYEKINGKEGAFRAYHFQELRFGRYAVSETQDAYDVYIYDMGEPVNGFGMYMSERSKSAATIALGRAGYLSGANAYFWKNKYYVTVLGPPDVDESKKAISLQIARAIEETITDDGEPFWAEAVLPTEHRLIDSLAYQATSALTFEFLDKLFIATYESAKGEAYQVYAGHYATPDKAREMFDQYVEEVAKYDKVIVNEAKEALPLIVSESAGYYTSMFVKGRYLGGVTECEAEELVIEQTSQFRDTLATEGDDKTKSEETIVTEEAG